MRTKNIPLLSALLLLMCTFQSLAQNTIIGKVTDNRTGEALEDVKVYWLGIEDAKNSFTTQEGVYQIAIPSQVYGMFSIATLAFELPGKQLHLEPINAAVLKSNFYEIDIQLKEQEISASTASHWEQSVYEIPASTVIISREEIERNGYMTLNEILESVPGFYTIDHRSESDVTLGVRGFWAPFNRNVLIQVNGVSMLSERQNDFPLNKINVAVESIERVEIVRGPLSLIYGAGAFFGVINIITLDPTGEEESGQVSSGWGDFNNFTQHFRYSLHKDGLLMSLNASNFMRDGFNQRWDDMISPAKYEFYDTTYSVTAPYDTITADQYRGKIIGGDRYSKKHQAVNFAMRYNKFTANLNYARSNFGFSFLHPGPQDRNDYRSNTINVQFGYAGEITRRDSSKQKSYTPFSYEIKVGHMFSLVDATYKYFLPESYTPGQDRVATLRTEVNSLWTIFNNEKAKRSLLLSSGIAYTNNYENHSIYNAAEFGLRNWYIGLTPGNSLQTSAFYSQFDAKFGDLQLVAGGRLEQQGAYNMLSQYNVDYQFSVPWDSSFPNPQQDTNIFIPHQMVAGQNDQNDRLNFIPRLAVLYKFADHDSSAHYLRAMYSQALKQSSVVDNANDILSVNPNNPIYLLPENIQTFEVGYTFNYEIEDFQRKERKALMVNVNAFRNELRNLVTRRAEIINGKYIATSRNGDQLSTNGIELITNGSYTLPRSKNQRTLSFLVNGNMTLQKTTDRASTENAVAFSPNLLAGFNIGFMIREGRKPRKGPRIGKTSFSLGMNYVGAMEAYLDYAQDTLNGEPIVRSFRIGEDTDDYALWSFNFRMSDIRFKKSEEGKSGRNAPRGYYLNVKVSNLFNKKYWYPTYTLNPWADLGMLGRPRQILVTVGYKF